MDYLDPKKKRKKKNQLLFMYALLGVAIGIATLVVVYNVNGYSIDRKTGDFVQNGLLYIDSRPESADIFLNGEKQRGGTDARLVVAEGEYKIELTREGYRPWVRDLILEGGSLRRLTYARLLPDQLESDSKITVGSEPRVLSQSNDKRWVLMDEPTTHLQFRVLDLERLQSPMTVVQLPIDFMSLPTGGAWEVIEWAEDNKTVLAKYTSGSSTEYALIQREDATKSVNLSKRYPTQSISEVALRGRDNSEFYFFDKATATLLRGSLDAPELTPVLTKALQVKTYGADGFLYVTKDETQKPGTVSVYLKDDEKDYKLRDLEESDTYLLEMSKLGAAYVLGIGSPKENRVIVYNDPIHALTKNETSSLPVATTVLRVQSPKELSISSDSSVIMVRGDRDAASHEFEADRSYSFSLAAPVKSGSELYWIDGQHFGYASESGLLMMSDFDGSNSYELVNTYQLLPAIFDRAMDTMFVVSPPLEGSKDYALESFFMRTSRDR